MQNCSVAVPGRRDQCENEDNPKKHSLSDPIYGLLTVPAGPVARAGSLVAEDAIEPVAVLSALWRIWGRCK